ncbi:uncharacterized protein FIBRA_08788 [Fibroporia radiculosa]|uniref:BCAS3 WD40 domain-containing protein n=1 Tax=Fibroporia radiculosa TaxID=599839 RepID=J4ICJ4_9APHY|nr:uncharacterized protein FIBRA_08788 [Fibroporia radiculosa]CCM06516.1 predicted protein [Fibroporia radiculosa]
MPAATKRNAISRKRIADDQAVSYPASHRAHAPTFDDEPYSIDASPFAPPALPPEEFVPEPDDMPEGIGDVLGMSDSAQSVPAYGRVESMFDAAPRNDAEDLRHLPLGRSPPAGRPQYATPPPASAAQLDVGHTRSPILSREPTTLETFSRTLRTYVPASISIPSAGPTPPRVSRPVSFGSFLSPTMSPHERDSRKRRGSDSTSGRPGSVSGWGAHRDGEEDTAVFNLDEEDPQDDRGSRRTAPRYPSADETEEIVWAGWDTLVEDDPLKPRRLLLLGYRSGLQVWDCSNLGSVSELLNLSGPQWGAVEQITVLPTPVLEKDYHRAKRPLLGVLCRTGDWSNFVLYSMRSHEIVKTMPFPGLTQFSAVSDFVVLATSNPQNLHVLSAGNFATLYTIPSSLISTAIISTSSLRNNTSVSEIELDADVNTPTSLYTSSDMPRSTFALSNRLLAFISPLAPHQPTISSETQSPSDLSAITDTTAKFGFSQADIGTTAARIGGTVFSGMKSLGGMAVSAAKAGVTAAVNADSSAARSVQGAGGLSNLFFSRGTPVASQQDHPSSDMRKSSASPSALPPSIPSAFSYGCNVVVLDLQCLLSGSPEPEKIAEFAGSKHQPITRLKFSEDGTSLALCFKDGRSARIFQLRPVPRTLRSFSSAESAQERGRDTPTFDGVHGQGTQPWHMYDLRRGRTSAVIDSMEWAHDGRWFAIGTRNRTVHVFAVNPYGGRPDEFSHLSSRVPNASVLPSLSNDIHPLIRLRSDKTPHPERGLAPIAVLFVRPIEVSIPSSLLPPAALSFTASSSPSSVQSSNHSSTQASRKVANQDVLVFDPYDGTLSLRRIVVERGANEFTLAASSIPIIGNTSMSLPGVNSLGRLSTSPSSTQTSPGKASGLTQMMGRSSELAGKERRVGSWNLRRGRDWPEVRKPIRPRSKVARPTQLTKEDWLSCAELSTHSSSIRVLPRTVYLSHQFTFHSFGEDYHALIRSHQFDVPAHKFEVRREVEVSAYSAGVGEFFVQGLPTARDVDQAASSFDEPLASALSAEIHYMNPSPPVLPMYPNGTPGSNTRSLKNAIPIRNVAAGLHDSMYEGFGRLRREIGKVRSPRLAAHPDDELSSSVPLEFDEEDEDFLDSNMGSGGHDTVSPSPSRGAGDSGESISTPSSTAEPLPVEDNRDDVWQGWEPEDQQAIEDAERFDDITVGFMDEEQAVLQTTKRDAGPKKKYKKSRIVHRA